MENESNILGVDAGSTTTKALLFNASQGTIDESGYLRTHATPAKTPRECICKLIKQTGGKTRKLIQADATGSGREVISEGGKSMIHVLISVVIPITMFFLMFGMGLTLSVKDFQLLMVYPKAVLIGFIVQLLIMPLMGLGLAHLFNLPLMLAVGLITASACPGGTTSNIVVHMGKGDTALSITLTAVATLATLFTLPFWVNYALRSFGGTETIVQMPLLKTAFQLGLFTVLPVMIGMFIRKHWPVWIEWEGKISKVSVSAMVLAFMIVGILDKGNTLNSAGMVIVPVILLLISGVLIGFGFPRLAGIDRRQSITVAVEICIKNTLLAIFLATNSLKNIDAIVAPALYLCLMLPVAIGVMTLCNMISKRTVEDNSITILKRN